MKTLGQKICIHVAEVTEYENKTKFADFKPTNLKL